MRFCSYESRAMNGVTTVFSGDKTEVPLYQDKRAVSPLVSHVGFSSCSCVNIDTGDWGIFEISGFFMGMVLAAKGWHGM